ncbi:hypothetical protein [Sphingomonas bacterium]|uniref:hypothetical protein n=1 Tax=Sphingomonas bacterium TaxID=1895847 RepID=UPI0015754AB4|nr:hypothetical protein [Sphingomonas bacterium]
MIRSGLRPILAIGMSCVCTQALAETPRDLLTQASFFDRDLVSAQRHVESAAQGATAILQRTPQNSEAALMRATAIGYDAKLTGSRSQAIAARTAFETLIAREPQNAEAQLALGAWHVGVVFKLGRFLGRAALGAQKSVGLAALDRAVALGGNRALFAGLSALLRLELDPSDPRGVQLAELASHEATPTPLDRIMQRSAVAILTPLRAHDGRATKLAAAQLLPFGQVAGIP